ncbi:MAG: M10 family metallopeptidase C-terminal domain-containing protein [Alphaproteobacteria bacterium]
MPATSKTSAEAAVQLNRSGARWVNPIGQPLAITYAFRASDDTYGDDHFGTNSFALFNASQIAAAELALQAWADVANIAFTRVGGSGYSDHAALLFGGFQKDYPLIGPSVAGEGIHAYAYLPETADRQDQSWEGDVWVNDYWTYVTAPQINGYGQAILVHEIGHALGLEHPGDYNRTDGQILTYANDAAYREDDAQYTVMSYFGEGNTGANWGGNWTAVPMLHDIAAIQRLYGINTATRAGDTVYGFNSNAGRAWFDAAISPLVICIWDAGGNDTLDLSGYANNQVIDLQAGHFSDAGGTRRQCLDRRRGDDRERRWRRRPRSDHRQRGREPVEWRRERRHDERACRQRRAGGRGRQRRHDRRRRIGSGTLFRCTRGLLR